MAKGNILKEAIADAKAVREVALANAKAALEEAFTPKLQNMLSAKLSEDLDEDYYEEEDKDLELGEMGGDHDEEGEVSMDEEIDLEEILNELELDEGKKADDEEVVESKDDDDKEEQLDEMKPHFKSGNKDGEALDHRYQADYVNENEDFDLDSLLKEINSMGAVKAPVRNKRKVAKHSTKRAFKQSHVKRNVSQHAKLRGNSANRMRKAPAGVPSLHETGGCRKQVAELNKIKKELKETKKAFTSVNNELIEVNLLNSKLLYVNRIFKANQLDEAQKLRVVETLDKADSSKEAKLIYETIKDTFNISKNTKSSSKRKSIKENLGMASKATGTSTAPKKEVISESNDMVARFKKLANIKINE